MSDKEEVTMIRPCNDFVLLEKEKAEEKTASEKYA